MGTTDRPTGHPTNPLCPFPAKFPLSLPATSTTVPCFNLTHVPSTYQVKQLHFIPFIYYLYRRAPSQFSVSLNALSAIWDHHKKELLASTTKALIPLIPSQVGYVKYNSHLTKQSLVLLRWIMRNNIHSSSSSHPHHKQK